MNIDSYLKLITGQSNLIDKLIKENEALREIIQEESYRAKLYVQSTIKFREKYEGLLKQLKDIR